MFKLSIIIFALSSFVFAYAQQGSNDPTFNIGSGANDVVYTNAIQNDGKIIIGGYFTSFNGVTANHIARLNPDGSLDPTFNVGSGFDSDVHYILIQDDGKILVGGMFYTYNGVSKNGIVRLNTDGTIDASFNSGTGLTLIRHMVQQPDNKTIVVGDFLTYNGSPARDIARLNTDGTLDPSFSSGTGVETPSIAAVQSDGKIIVGGVFTSYNGTNINRIMRLNPDGSLDGSFNVGTGANDLVESLCIQPSGKIIIGGTFTSYNGIARSHIARLNTDGSLDPTFSDGYWTNGPVMTLLAQQDGKLLVGGGFNSGPHFITRLNLNGTMDSNFNPGIGTNHIVTGIGIQSDNKIIINGYLTSYNGTTRNRITRIQNTGIVPVYLSETACNSFTLNSQTYTTSGEYTNILANSEGYDSIVTILNLTVLNSSAITDVQTACGPYTWIDGNTYFSSTNTPTFTLTNTVGCDSLVTLNLTILSTSGVDTQTACDSYNWIDGNTYNTSTNSPTFTLTNAVGCDSVVTLNLTINNPSVGTDVQTTCNAYTWIDGNTYISSTNTPTFNLTNAVGCDSIVTLNLTIIADLPTVVESGFSMPSDANNCLGESAIDISGNPDFELNIDNGAQTATTSAYNLFTGLCPGVHDLQIINFCGDTTETQFVIPIDSNYVFNNPFIDSLAQDSLGTTLENCDIYYAGIDTAYIDSIWATGNTVNVIWNIIDSNGSNLDTTTYELNNGNGVYWLQLSVFCPTKALGDYFAVTEAIYFEDGNISTAGISEDYLDSFVLYPNPTNDLVTISFDGNSANYTIYDAQGKRIQTSSIQSGGTVSLRDVQTGVYFFELTTESGRTVKRVVKN